MEEKIRHLLNTRVTTDQIRTYFKQQELFCRCSFYIEIKGKDLETQTTMSVPVRYLNPQRFMRVKCDAKTQVRVQLAYQTELLKKLVRSREDIAVIADKIHHGYVVREEDDIDRKMSELLDTAAEFENSLLLGPVHNRHKLIFEATRAEVIPRLTLELKLKKPVIFERDLCVVSSEVAYLQWRIQEDQEQEQDDPGEEFKIQYEVRDSGLHDASNQWINCGLNRAVIISNLIPGKLYKFTINRVNSCYLVYSKWTDTIWRTTSPDC
ncbi:fibronectin type III domain-containing protein 11-like [Astyanax mexicanus]|nr:fibronectin type III domain-containing protein 11-like [Astyanax mexicanus]